MATPIGYTSTGAPIYESKYEQYRWTNRRRGLERPDVDLVAEYTDPYGTGAADNRVVYNLGDGCRRVMPKRGDRR